MGSEPIVSTKVISALGAFLGALAGGVAAIVAELRRPVAPAAADAGEAPPAPEATRVIAAVREESDHISRTIWTLEKKIGERLHRIGRDILARGGKARQRRLARPSAGLGARVASCHTFSRQAG